MQHRAGRLWIQIIIPDQCQCVSVKNLLFLKCLLRLFAPKFFKILLIQMWRFNEILKGIRSYIFSKKYDGKLPRASFTQLRGLIVQFRTTENPCRRLSAFLVPDYPCQIPERRWNWSRGLTWVIIRLSLWLLKTQNYYIKLGFTYPGGERGFTHTHSWKTVEK